jgi:hypothetical protein
MDSSLDFEEISVDSSNNNSPQPKPGRMRVIRRESLASQLNKLKSNPDTFDYEGMLKQIKKRPVKFSSTSPPVVERLLFSHQLSQNKKRFLAQQKETEEKKLCTFKPKVTSPARKRSFENFYLQQQLFENKKHEKIEEMKEDQSKKMQESESCELRPVGMSKGSKIILLRKENKYLPETTLSEMGNLYKTISVSQGIFKSMGRPPLPKSPRNELK